MSCISYTYVAYLVREGAGHVVVDIALDRIKIVFNALCHGGNLRAGCIVRVAVPNPSGIGVAKVGVHTLEVVYRAEDRIIHIWADFIGQPLALRKLPDVEHLWRRAGIQVHPRCAGVALRLVGAVL